MQSHTDTYEIVTDAQALRALEPEWDALNARSCEQRFSRSFAWCWTTWMRVEQPRGCRLYVLVAREAARTTLIWPFVVRRELCWSLARPLGAFYGEYTDALLEAGPAAASRLAAAWRKVRATCRADVITLPWVRTDSDLYRLLEHEHDARVTSSTPTLAVEWSRGEDWQSYERRWAVDLRRHVRKGRRDLEQLGRLELEVAEGGAECVAVIDWLLPRKVEQLSRSGRRGPWLEHEPYRKLLCDAAMQASPAGSVITFALRLDGRILAALMARRDARRIEMMNTVFDPAYARYRPGHVLMAQALQWAHARGLIFDLRLGDYPYKQRWSNTRCDVVTYVCVNSHLGRAHVAYRATRERLDRARRKVRERLRRTRAHAQEPHAPQQRADPDPRASSSHPS